MIVNKTAGCVRNNLFLFRCLLTSAANFAIPSIHFRRRVDSNSFFIFSSSNCQLHLERNKPHYHAVSGIGFLPFVCRYADFGIARISDAIFCSKSVLLGSISKLRPRLIGRRRMPRRSFHSFAQPRFSTAIVREENVGEDSRQVSRGGRVC